MISKKTGRKKNQLDLILRTMCSTFLILVESSLKSNRAHSEIARAFYQTRRKTTSTYVVQLEKELLPEPTLNSWQKKLAPQPVQKDKGMVGDFARTAEAP